MTGLRLYDRRCFFVSQNVKKTAAMDLLYLVSCAVNEETPCSERCAAIDTEAVLKLAKVHMLSAAAAFALEKTITLPPAWKNAKGTAMRRMILFDAERARVLRTLDENGIWFLPLKGCVLKDYYPKAAMREMADNDILCDGSRMADVREIMSQLGYQCEFFNLSNHDVYQKDVMSFEMHKSLFKPSLSPAFDAYYADIKDRLVRDADTRFGYHMTDEDFYIYILCHMFKHYDNGGINLRTLLDIYVINKKNGDSLDWDYVGRELERLEMKSFERDMRLFAAKTFSMQPLSDEEQDQLSFFINSSCFGFFSSSLSKQLNNDDSKKAKRRYVLSRIFPNAEFLEKYHPVVYRYRILYPFLLIYRAVIGLIKKPKRLLSEYRTLKSFKKEYTIDSSQSGSLKK